MQLSLEESRFVEELRCLTELQRKVILLTVAKMAVKRTNALPENVVPLRIPRGHKRLP